MPWGHIFNHIHGALGHYPLALLVVGIVLDFASRRSPNLQFSAWLLIALGTLGAVGATISGLIAHIPYEETAAYEHIELHQWLAFATTALFIGLTAWRWQVLRRTNQFRANGVWTVLTVLGLVVLTITGYTGGQLVLQYGVGVQQLLR